MTRKIVKITTFVLCLLLLVAILSMVIGISKFKSSADFIKLDTAKLNEVRSDLIITDERGNRLKDTFYFGDNKQIPLTSLHDYTYLAFVAVEDKRFFNHGGLDTKRILGAAISNIRSGGFKEGASTITQQLIKNTHLSRDKTLRRKANEMLLALELENRYTKKEILEMYLNTIYFGRNAYGIENAANAYFNKGADELTVAESATLAGMIKAPNVYAPDKNIERCKARRDTVLQLMFEQKIINENCYSDAILEEITYHPYVHRDIKTYARMAIDEACEILNVTQAQLLHSNYVVETYYDEKIQAQLNECVSTDNTQNKDGSTADLSGIICNNNGGVAACYFRGESSITSKQVGSTAKPFAVYAPAFCEKIITQASPVLDEETNFSGYKPSNSGKYYGWTTIKEAVTRSLNVPAVKTLNALGLSTAEKYLKKMGICGEQNLSLALGNIDGGLTARQLANCYLVLANGGNRNDSRFVKSIRKGEKIIYQHKENKERVFDEKSTYLMTDLLRNVVQNGTARKMKDNYQIAAKTGTVGTSDGNSQALVAGYTTEHTFVFWFSGAMSNSVNGSSAPCILAKRVLGKMYSASRPKDFSVPVGIKSIAVDSQNLHNNQLVTRSENGEAFLFDCQNAPKMTAAHQFNYKISTCNDGQTIRLSLPEVEKAFWKIFQNCTDGDCEIFEMTVGDGDYYAQLWQNNRCVYTTPTIHVETAKDLPYVPHWLFG